MSKKCESSKWIAILGLVIAFSTYYFNVYLHAPTIVHTEVKCPEVFNKHIGELMSITLTNYGDGVTTYKLTLEGEGVIFKKSSIATYVDKDKLKKYKPKIELSYAIGPKTSNSFSFHAYLNTSSLKEIKYYMLLEYDTLPLIPIPFMTRHLKYKIVECEYLLNSTDSQYHLVSK